MSLSNSALQQKWTKRKWFSPRRWNESQPPPIPHLPPPTLLRSNRRDFCPSIARPVVSLPPTESRLRWISCSLECRARAVRHGAGDTLLGWDHRQLLIPLDAHDLRGSSEIGTVASRDSSPPSSLACPVLQSTALNS